MSAHLQSVGRDLINPPFFHLLFCSLPVDTDIDGISGVRFGLKLCFLGSLGMFFKKIIVYLVSGLVLMIQFWLCRFKSTVQDPF